MNKGPWQDSFRDNPQETMDMVQAIVYADNLLRLAVEFAGVGWCIDRLKAVNKTKGNLPSILDTVMGVNNERRDQER